MKNLKGLFLAFVLALGLASCNDTGTNNVTIQSNNVPNFDVAKMGQVIEKSSDPKAIEAAINDTSKGINNLDLNNDGKVDYCSVTELAGNKLQVVDIDVNPNVIIVPSIGFTKNAQTGQTALDVQGNQSYCGSNYQYHDDHLLMDMVLLSYLTRPHVVYSSPYHYGAHPTTTTTVRRVYSSPTTAKSNDHWYSPKRSSVSDPVKSQRSFTTTKNDGAPIKTKFGNSSSSSSSSSSWKSSTPRSYSAPRSSFGGGRR